MTEVRFYHMTRTPLDQALPKMLERTLERGQRAVVRAGSEARVEALSARLWTYHDRSFLPHGTVKDGRAERQPVWLTVADDDAPNPAHSNARPHSPNAPDHTILPYMIRTRPSARLTSRTGVSVGQTTEASVS